MAAPGEGGPPSHSLELGWAFLGTFQGKAKQPSFHLGEEMEQDTLPTGS